MIEDVELVSIIVPIYNVEKYLEKCLDSIVCQTYKNIEIILVVDGSPDNSINICRKYEKEDSRIKVIEKENGGLASARNAGLKIMKGKYLVCVDSDDWIEESMVERLLDNLKKNNADMSVCTHYDEYLDNKLSHKVYSGEIIILNKDEAMIYAILPTRYYGFAWNKMYKVELIGKQLYDEKIKKGEDSPFTCEYINKCERVVYMDTPLYHYRQDSISISRSKFNIGKMTVLDAYMYIVNLLISNNYDKKIVDMQKVQYANQLLSVLVNIMNTDLKKYKNEAKCIKEQMKVYKKLYCLSKDVDLLHKAIYCIANRSLFLLQIICVIKNLCSK